MKYDEMYMCWDIEHEKLRGATMSIWHVLTARANPAKNYIAKMTNPLLIKHARVDVRSVRRAITALEELKLITSYKGNGRRSYSQYKIDMGRVKELLGPDYEPYQIPQPIQEDEVPDLTPLELAIAEAEKEFKGGTTPPFNEAEEGESSKGGIESEKGGIESEKGGTTPPLKNLKNINNSARVTHTRIGTPHTASDEAEASDLKEEAEGATVNRPDGAGSESREYVPIIQGLQCSNEHWQDFQLCLQEEALSNWSLNGATFSGFEGSKPMIIFDAAHKNDYFHKYGGRKRLIDAYEAILRDRVGEIEPDMAKEAAE